MKSLADTIRFYNTSDTNPERWYPVVDGVVQKYFYLPAAYRRNIGVQALTDDDGPPLAALGFDRGIRRPVVAGRASSR